MESNLSTEFYVTMISTIVCVLISMVGFHFYRISTNAKSDTLPTWLSTFYFIWKRVYGIFGLILFPMPLIITTIIRHRIGFNHIPKETTSSDVA